MYEELDFTAKRTFALRKTLAHTVQYPNHKLGIMLCLVGPMGAYTLTPLEGGWGPSAGRFIFFSSRPLQGAQYGGALRHCTLTPLHPCALFS